MNPAERRTQPPIAAMSWIIAARGFPVRCEPATSRRCGDECRPGEETRDPLTSSSSRCGEDEPAPCQLG